MAIVPIVLSFWCLHSPEKDIQWNNGSMNYKCYEYEAVTTQQKTLRKEIHSWTDQQSINCFYSLLSHLKVFNGSAQCKIV